MANLSDIFDWFSVGRTPTAQQFRDTFSSFFHKSEKLPQTAIYGLTDDLNDKASKNDLANATTKFKGYHTSQDLLQAEYPQASNKKDFYAWVGTPYPGTVYKVYADGGAWTNTGEVPTQQEIDLAEYVKKQTIYNVSQSNNSYAYVDKQTARNAVPANKRAKTQILIYTLADNILVTEQFIGTDISEWEVESNWKDLGAELPDNLVYFKKGLITDITANAKTRISNIICTGNPGDNFPLAGGQWSGIFMLKLDPKTRYVYTSPPYPETTATTIIGGLYTSNIIENNNKAVVDIYASLDGKVTFNTTSTAIYLIMWIGRSDKGAYNYNFENSFSLCSEKTEDVKEIDITDDVKNYLKGATTNLNEVVQWDNTRQSIAFYPLERNTHYIVKGLHYSWNANGGQPAINAEVILTTVPQYNVGGTRINAKEKYGDIEFTTGDEYLFMSMQIIRQVDDTWSAPFDVSSTFQVITRQNKVATHNLYDRKGNLLHISGQNSSYIESDAIEEIEISDSYKVTGQWIQQNIAGDLSAAGNIGTWSEPSLLLKHFPLEEGFWYYLDYGLSKPITGTNFAFIHGKNDLNSAVTYFPMTSKAQFYCGGGMDYLSLYLMNVWGNLNVNFDASTTFKLYKSKKPIKGFVTDYGFLNLRDINGLIDHTDEDVATIPFPKMFGIFRTWGSDYKMTKDERCRKRFELISDGHIVRGYTDEGLQGDSTVTYSFKNKKDKFYKMDGKTRFNLQIGNCVGRSKAHRKACWTDVTTSKNIVPVRIWQRILDSYPEESRYPWSEPYTKDISDFDRRFNSGATMHTEGFPILSYENGAFVGIRTLQLSTDREDFNMMKKNINHNVFKSGSQTNLIDPVRTNWEEINSDTEGNDIPNERWQILVNWMAWAKGASVSNGDFKAQAPEFIDVRSFIDYYLMVYWGGMADNWGKNILLLTRDGKKMYAVLRDTDLSYGTMMPNLVPPTQEMTNPFGGFSWWAMPTYPANPTFWGKFQTAFTKEIKERYKELRDNNILNKDTIIEEFRKWEKSIPYNWLKLNAETWPLIMTNRPKFDFEPGLENGYGKGGCYSSFCHIYWWVEQRAQYMDKKFGG